MLKPVTANDLHIILANCQDRTALEPLRNTVQGKLLEMEPQLEEVKAEDSDPVVGMLCRVCALIGCVELPKGDSPSSQSHNPRNQMSRPRHGPRSRRLTTDVIAMIVMVAADWLMNGAGE